MRPIILSPLLRGCKPHFVPRHCKTTTLRPLTTILNHAAPYSHSSPPFNPDTYLTAARQKLASQPPTLIPDHLSPTNSRLLTLSLADHVPALFPPSSSSSSSSPSQAPALPQGHHLVYFPLQLPPSRLMPDGTDPGHCPGAPFVRRMWAGGEVVFREGWEEALRLDGRSVSCVERVGEPVLKGGKAGEVGGEKVFVEVTREYGVEGEGAVVEEVRRLVFLREREGKGAAQVAARVVKGRFFFLLFGCFVLASQLTARSSPCHPRVYLHPHARRNAALPIQRSHLQRSLHPPRPGLRSQPRGLQGPACPRPLVTCAHALGTAGVSDANAFLELLFRGSQGPKGPLRQVPKLPQRSSTLCWRADEGVSSEDQGRG